MFDRISKDTQKFIYYAFLALVIAWTANRTLSAARDVLPNDTLSPFIALGLFDAGALGWLSAFLGHGKGTQRTIAFWMIFFSLTGIALMVAGSLHLLDALTIRYTLMASTLLNIFAAYVYHITSPTNKEQIESQNLEDHLEAEALKIARTDIEKQARQLGLIMSRRVTARIKYRLTLPMTQAEKDEWKNSAVEGETVETHALPAPQGAAVPNLFTRLIGFFAGRWKSKPSEPITTTTSNISDSPEAPAPAPEAPPENQNRPQRPPEA